MELDDQISTAHLLLETRRCRVCKKEKNLLDEYYLSRKDPTKKSSYSYECKECTVARTVEYNRANSTSIKSQYLKRNYGLTFEQFEAMLSDQDNCCAICKSKDSNSRRRRRFSVDHCHKTGKIRGLLCHKCNTALGLVEDNIHILNTMIEYLESHEHQQDRHAGDECSSIS